MNLEEKKILAMVECLLIWDDLSISGNWNKFDSVKKLEHGGLISEYPENECPFCHYLRKRDTDGECSGYDDACDYCPWPGFGYLRCCEDDEPYDIWCHANGRWDRKKAAKKVFDMLMSIEF